MQKYLYVGTFKQLLAPKTARGGSGLGSLKNPLGRRYFLMPTSDMARKNNVKKEPSRVHNQGLQRTINKGIS